MAQQACRLHLPGSPPRELDWLCHVPVSARGDETRRWPVILFLHGSGERGDDLSIVKRHGLPAIVEHNEDFPFIVVSPQCPSRSGWHTQLQALHSLVDRVFGTLPADPERLYLTGISMGGFGAWCLASRYPELFAAVAPICGYGATSQGFPHRVKDLRFVPVWVFHGALDDTVPVSESDRLVHALRDFGGDVRYTMYPDLGHDCWNTVYADEALYEWFLEHRRKAAEPARR